jgi:RNA polymerase sigma-70 factor (ECF subfamily)
VAAARVPIRGAQAVAKVLAGAHRAVTSLETATVWLNGAPAGRIELDGEPAAISIDVEAGRITGVYVVRNPVKLSHLDRLAELAR